MNVYGKKFKLACVDGSLFGKFYGCVLQLLGEANLLLDIAVTTGKGKEIPTTRALLQEHYSIELSGNMEKDLLTYSCLMHFMQISR